MKSYRTGLSVGLAGLAVSALLLGTPALAQNQPSHPPSQQTPQPECAKSGVAEKIEGQVTKVDPNEGKIAVRTSAGENYEFQASKETLESYKVGDHIQARLRQHPNCKPTG